MVRFFFSPQGRIGNAAYLLGFAFLSPLFFLFNIGTEALARGAVKSPASFMIPVLGFFLIWAMLVLIVKRLHDLNLRGWWWLIPMATQILITLPLLYAATLTMGLMQGDSGRNRFGAPPSDINRWRFQFQLWRQGRRFKKGAIDAARYTAARAALLAYYFPPRS